MPISLAYQTIVLIFVSPRAGIVAARTLAIVSGKPSLQAMTKNASCAHERSEPSTSALRPSRERTAWRASSA